MDRINVENMSEEELQSTMTELGVNIDSTLVKAKNEINYMLSKYGLCIELGFDIKLKE